MLRTSCVFLVLLSLAFFTFDCSHKESRDIFSELMEKMVDLAEKKDLTGLMLYFDQDYSDFQGRGKKDTREFLSNYLNSYSNPVIHVLGTKIDNLTLEEADIQTEIAISSGAAKVFRKLVKASLDNYRLRINFVQNNGNWKVRYAEWRYLSIDELYPESYALLKKIFPGL